MKQLIKICKQITLFIFAIFIVSCDQNDAILPMVVADFTYKINPITGTVTFINTSENANTYNWSFGDNPETSSTDINPIKTFTAGEYLITLKATNASGASDIIQYLIVISDVGAPIITLLGDTSINVMVGGTFTDPGATATDDVDGDLTANIVVGGDTVDVNTAGTYVITYNVSDISGNAATQRTRTVIVANDTVAPVITLIGSATMTIIKGGTFTDPGATATDDVDGIITANIVVAGDAVNVNTAGTYVITYNVKDAAGNAAAQKTRTVIVSDPNTCTTDAAQTLTAVGFNLTFAANPGTMATRGEAVGKFLQDGTTYAYVDNPGVSTVNNSCKVGKVINGNINPWDNIQIDLANKLTLTDGSTFKIKVYAPQSGYKVTLKLEDKASSGAINSGDKKSITSTTLINGWEELTFNVGATDSGKYDKIVLFFDLETKNGNTYYFDDLKLNLGTGGSGGGGTGNTLGLATNGDFETGTLDGWVAYRNGGIVEVTNTDNNGGSWSARLIATGITGNNPTLKQERKGAGTIKVGDRVRVSFDYKGSTVGISGMYSFQSFVEATNGANQVETFDLTPTNTWQSFTKTYTVTSGTQNNVSGGITTEFVAICGGVAGCGSTLLLDNVSIVINP